MPALLQQQRRCGAKSQRPRGYILLLVMVFLLLLAVLAATALRVSALEFRLAGNDQFREQALQQALGIARALALNPAHFPLDLAVGDSLCGEGATCTRPVLPAAPSGHAPPGGSTLDYRITRRGPPLAPVPDFRLPQARASGASGWQAASFEVQVSIDGTEVGLGSAQVVQGVALLVPAQSS
ncbi:hypothetical protein Q6D67_12290 [Haliea sp. E1-2-M8]|uniref:hypothetical protein n=1 Tax=Haliea sp. E1-2-M8 TaxID=3064706 RepID=UPI002718AC6A|nr:hypothetical protein [Haliea sp. E1-2-M8]MDO8862481.1 hypothetical protein [Haliea sp. E1-2-M8]